MANLICNAIVTPDGTRLESRHRHDCQRYQDANGQEYMIDGGLSYVRSTAWGDEVWVGCYDDDPIEEIREKFRWGSYGKNGKSGLTHSFLKDMSEDHIRAILANCQLLQHIENMFREELEYRKEHDES